VSPLAGKEDEDEFNVADGEAKEGEQDEGVRVNKLSRRSRARKFFENAAYACENSTSARVRHDLAFKTHISIVR
jgi:hypothetical protein